MMMAVMAKMAKMVKSSRLLLVLVPGLIERCGWAEHRRTHGLQ